MSQQSREVVVVVGAQQAVGHALCEQWSARGVEVRGVEDVRSAAQLRGEGVGILYVDTSVWWGEGEVSEEDFGCYHDWMGWAKRYGVGRVGVITSAATLGEGCEESGLYVAGEGEAWEDDVWRFEAEGYAYMGLGLRVWFALPTMVVGEAGELGRTVMWSKKGGMGGDVVSAQDVARGCMAMMERGRMGRRYVMSGEWVDATHQGERVYLGGRRYDVEWSRAELGYGGRLSGEALQAQLRKRQT